MISQQSRQSAQNQAQLAYFADQVTESQRHIEQLQRQIAQLKDAEHNDNTLKEIERLNQLQAKLDDMKASRNKVLSDLDPATRSRARNRERLLFDPAPNELDRIQAAQPAHPAQPKKRARSSYFSEFDETNEDYSMADESIKRRSTPASSTTSYRSSSNRLSPIAPVISPVAHPNNQSHMAHNSPRLESVSRPSLTNSAGGVRFFDDTFSSDSDTEPPVKPRSGVIRFRKGQ